jgi:ABC-type multidrug transport system ATPase subunit
MNSYCTDNNGLFDAGPPGCGKRSLHRLLSGHITTYEGLITYNDERIRNIQVQDLAAMVESLDNHLPFLTVRETIEFARKCLLTFGPKQFGPELLEIMGDALKVGQDPKVEIILSMLGLKHVADRFVGSSLNPTIREDERRRLTAAEMFAGVHAVYFLDELNTAVEDAVTYDLLTAIRIFTRVRQTTFVASLFQPSCDVFDLFDRLILLNQGHIVYQGPRQDALPYFESIG